MTPLPHKKEPIRINFSTTELLFALAFGIAFGLILSLWLRIAMIHKPERDAQIIEAASGALPE